MRRRILIVDDNPMNLKLARLVVMAEGHDVDVADSAAKAMERLRLARPDVILMDLQMPEVDGYELTRRLKNDMNWRDIPIIALTAAARNDDRTRAAEAGCDGFIPKPLDTRALGAELSPFLAGSVAA